MDENTPLNSENSAPAAPVGTTAPVNSTVAAAPGALHGYNLFALISFLSAFSLVIPSLVLAPIALKQIRSSGEKGRGLAISALIVSIACLVLGVIVMLVWIGFVIAAIASCAQYPELCTDLSYEF